MLVMLHHCPLYYLLPPTRNSPRPIPPRPPPGGHTGSSCSHSGGGGAGGAPLGHWDPLDALEGVGGRHSTAGRSSCSLQPPDPGAVRRLSAVHTGYLSPSLGALPRGDTEAQAPGPAQEPTISAPVLPLTFQSLSLLVNQDLINL